MPRLLLLLFCAFSLAPAVTAADRVFIIYDEQEITDADRAELLHALGFVVLKEQWREITVAEATTLNGIVDTYYDYWENPANKEQYPLSARAVAYHINRDKMNPVIRPQGAQLLEFEVAAGAKLRIPPLPVRAEWANEKVRRIRLYDPVTRKYGELDSLDAAIPNATVATDAPADGNHPFREARLTVFEVPDWEDFAKKLESGDEAEAEAPRATVTDPHALRRQARLPPSVVVRSETNFLEMKLCDFVCGGEADGNAVELSTLPHLAALKTAIAPRLDTLPELLKVKPLFPLWIVDWDFATPAGHGNKVRAVVDEVLDKVGLADLGKHVQTFDLNPHHNKKLKEVLDRYRAFLLANKAMDEKTAEFHFRVAEEWIANPPPFPNDDTTPIQINEYVLQSVLWLILFNEPKWVNLSFTVRAPHSQLLNSIFMANAPGFAFVAAGNNRDVALTSASYPQVGAKTYETKFVNVTFGRNGVPDGTVTGEVPVDLVATGSFKLRDGRIVTGSSFASPYVAVTAWIKHFFDDTLPKQMRPLLRGANHPVASRKRYVETRGVYDPSLLFSGKRSQPVLVVSDGREFPLTNAKIAGTWEDPQTGDEMPLQLPVGKLTEPKGNRVLLFRETPDGETGIWVRRPDAKVEVLKLKSFSIIGAGEVDQWTIEKLAEMRAELHF